MNRINPTSYKLQATHSSRGFTLVEMIVTVGIFALISASIIARNATFDEEVLLNNMAYDIALSVRRAQNYGINVRASEGQFDRPYGVHFNTGEQTYAFFADADADDLYDAPEELLETFTLGRGATVKALCDLSNTSCDLKELTVLFKRPDPDAVMYSEKTPIARSRIDIESARGGLRSIVIEATGQISIQGVEEQTPQQ